MKIRRFKSASLELSVNAIIVFVLAFSMLGVGIFVTSKVKDAAGGGLDKAGEIVAGIEEDPTSDKPLVGIGKELDIPAKKRMPTGIKFYNSDADEIVEAEIVIDNCKGTSDDNAGDIYSYMETGEYPVLVVSDTVDIAPSSFKAIPFTIKNTQLTGGESYICKLQLIDKDDEIKYSYSFFLNVRS